MGSGDWGNGHHDRERSWGAATPRPGEQGELWKAEETSGSWPAAGPSRGTPPRTSEGYPSTQPPPNDPSGYYQAPRNPAATGWGRTGPSPISPAPSGRRPSLTSAVTAHHAPPRPPSRATPPPPVPVKPTSRDEDTDEEEYEDPAYGRVLGFTIAWFGLPSLLYLLWMLTLTGDRRSIVLNTFSGSLGWIAGAGILSVIVAAILRWAVTGWRALTISFAGAVIGSGVATIAHSLAFSPG